MLLNGRVPSLKNVGCIHFFHILHYKASKLVQNWSVYYESSLKLSYQQNLKLYQFNVQWMARADLNVLFYMDQCEQFLKSFPFNYRSLSPGDLQYNNVFPYIGL